VSVRETRVRGVYQWKLSEKSKKGECSAHRDWANTRPDHSRGTRCWRITPPMKIEAVLAHELGHHVHRHIFKSILVQAGITFVGFWSANLVLHYAVDRQHMFETLSDFANLPLLMLVATTLSLLVLPVAECLFTIQRTPGPIVTLSRSISHGFSLLLLP